MPKSFLSIKICPNRKLRAQILLFYSGRTSIAQQKFMPGFGALAQYFKQLGMELNNRVHIFAQLY